MSDFKGTPGPWYWSPDYKTGDGRATWSLIGSDGYGILSCDGEENSPQGLSDGANAHLIAAAPELLEACRGFVEEYGRRCGPADELVSADGQDPIVAAAMRAIAKATGDQP